MLVASGLAPSYLLLYVIVIPLLPGRVLLFNSMLIAILILRNLITALRELGLTTILPLDNNIYIHKLVGYLIFVQAWIHSIMHLINFCEFQLKV